MTDATSPLRSSTATRWTYIQHLPQDLVATVGGFRNYSNVSPGTGRSIRRARSSVSEGRSPKARR